MSTSMIVGIVVLVATVVVIGVVSYVAARRNRTSALRTQYGSEYDRTVRHASSRRIAEAELAKRQDRVDNLDIRPLLAEQRELFEQQWHDLQEMFVEDPGGAVNHADSLVMDVMRTRGYPVANFEQRAADLSVHHARFVRNYRAARDVAERHRRAAATTEELRRAMVYYHELFDDLLGPELATTDRPIKMEVARDVAPPVRAEPVRPDRPRRDALPLDDEVR
jgi:hypothetical protein